MHSATPDEEETTDYLLIEAEGKSPEIRGFDSYLMPWKARLSIIDDYLDALTPGEKATLSFTVFRWTKAEYEDYIHKNDIEWS